MSITPRWTLVMSFTARVIRGLHDWNPLHEGRRCGTNSGTGPTRCPRVWRPFYCDPWFVGFREASDQERGHVWLLFLCSFCMASGRHIDLQPRVIFCCSWCRENRGLILVWWAQLRPSCSLRIGSQERSEVQLSGMWKLVIGGETMYANEAGYLLHYTGAPEWYIVLSCSLLSG